MTQGTRTTGYEAFFNEQFTRVARSAALVTGDLQEGMDVAQEAMARTYQHWRKVSVMDRPDAWVHKVATNLALSRLRRRQTRPIASEPLASEAATSMTSCWMRSDPCRLRNAR